MIIEGMNRKGIKDELRVGPCPSFPQFCQQFTKDGKFEGWIWLLLIHFDCGKRYDYGSSFVIIILLNFPLLLSIPDSLSLSLSNRPLNLQNKSRIMEPFKLKTEQKCEKGEKRRRKDDIKFPSAFHFWNTFIPHFWSSAMNLNPSFFLSFFLFLSFEWKHFQERNINLFSLVFLLHRPIQSQFVFTNKDTAKDGNLFLSPLNHSFPSLQMVQVMAAKSGKWWRVVYQIHETGIYEFGFRFLPKREGRSFVCSSPPPLSCSQVICPMLRSHESWRGQEGERDRNGKTWFVSQSDLFLLPKDVWWQQRNHFNDPFLTDMFTNSTFSSLLSFPFDSLVTDTYIYNHCSNSSFIYDSETCFLTRLSFSPSSLLPPLPKLS